MFKILAYELKAKTRLVKSKSYENEYWKNIWGFKDYIKNQNNKKINKWTILNLNAIPNFI